MEKKYDVITAMDLCVDLLVALGDVLPEFHQKEQIVEDYHMELGGSCSIFASQIAKLGLRIAGIGRVGQDSLGTLVLDRLKEVGIITENIEKDPSLKTGIGVALCKEDGDRAILTYPGTIDAVEKRDITDDLLMSTRHIHVGSYYLLKKLQPYYPRILRKAKEFGVTVSLDTNWDPDESWDGGLEDILQYVDIFMPNENEIKLITRKDTVESAMEALSNVIPVVAVKLGEKGAVAYAHGKEYRASAMKVDVVDTVGAGDNFDAGFVYGYLNGMDIERCLRIGCMCGSYSTMKAGGIAGQLRRSDIKDI